MLLSEAFHALAASLTDRYGVAEASSIASIVLEDAFQWKKGRPDLPLEPEAEQKYRHISGRLMQGEPLQYVLGEADFFGLKFKVSPAVLIPRQETEELVDWALRLLKTQSELRPVVLDIGLGSGCIGLTIKKKHPAVQLFGMEKSGQALEIARDNALRLLGPEVSDIQLLSGDILDQNTWMDWPVCDLIVSNPPYIPWSEKMLMPAHVYAHEPSLALFVEDKDPLLFYKAIADFAIARLRTGGMLLFECNEFHARAACRLLENKGFDKVELKKDLAGAERMLLGVLPVHTQH